jgi:hypothetical protein
LVLYRPWQGDGIAISALGLRTALPAPKKPGEWRIAVSGGSEVWGWRVLDADTIPVRLQDVLRRAGHSNVTVYNLGMAGATFKQELRLLQRFRDAYAIDQVLFFTGGNDAVFGYLNATSQHFGPWAENALAFELLKVAMRLQAMWSEPSAQMLQWLDDEVLPAALNNNTLRRGIAEADDYCRMAMLRCDFVLQPVLNERKTHSASEARMVKMFARIYPRIDVFTARMFRDALASGPAGRMHDFAHIFDQTEETFSSTSSTSTRREAALPRSRSRRLPRRDCRDLANARHRNAIYRHLHRFVTTRRPPDLDNENLSWLPAHPSHLNPGRFAQTGKRSARP